MSRVTVTALLLLSSVDLEQVNDQLQQLLHLKKPRKQPGSRKTLVTLQCDG